MGSEQRGSDIYDSGLAMGFVDSVVQHTIFTA